MGRVEDYRPITAFLPERVLDAREVAELLGVSRRTVTRLIRRGDLQPVRIGARSTRFRSSDIEELIAAGASRYKKELDPAGRPGRAKGARGRAHGGS